MQLQHQRKKKAEATQQPTDQPTNTTTQHRHIKHTQNNRSTPPTTLNHRRPSPPATTLATSTLTITTLTPIRHSQEFQPTPIHERHPSTAATPRKWQPTILSLSLSGERERIVGSLRRQFAEGRETGRLARLRSSWSLCFSNPSKSPTGVETISTVRSWCVWFLVKSLCCGWLVCVCVHVRVCVCGGGSGWWTVDGGHRVANDGHVGTDPRGQTIDSCRCLWSVACYNLYDAGCCSCP